MLLKDTRIIKAVTQPRIACHFILCRAKALWYRLKYETILKRARFGRRMRIDGRLRVRGPGKVVVGDDVLISGLVTPYTHSPEAVIEIGDGVYLNGTRFAAAQHIKVGSRCILADCRIMDTDFHGLGKDRHSPNANVGVSPVLIEDNVWIAAQSAVLKGVTIGANTVVGFGSVVTADLGSNIVAAGNPARFVKKIPDGTE